MYNLIEKILKHKDYITIIRSDNKYMLMSSTKDSYGDFRDSGWWGDKENAIKAMRVDCGYTKGDIERLSKKENWQIIDTWDNPKERFEIGDEVIVLDRDLSDNTDLHLKEKRVMIGNTYKVTRRMLFSYVLDDNDFFFPQSSLSVPFKVNKEKEEIKKNIKRLKKELKGLEDKLNI